MLVPVLGMLFVYLFLLFDDAGSMIDSRVLQCYSVLYSMKTMVGIPHNRSTRE